MSASVPDPISPASIFNPRPTIRDTTGTDVLAGPFVSHRTPAGPVVVLPDFVPLESVTVHPSGARGSAVICPIAMITPSLNASR
jgi:hypothetical protein